MGGGSALDGKMQVNGSPGCFSMRSVLVFIYNLLVAGYSCRSESATLKLHLRSSTEKAGL
jgi:hypothetical protein